MNGSADELPALVVFDLAGTTVRDAGQVPSAFTAALAEHGVVVRPDEIANVRGASKREAIRSFFPAGPEQEREAESAYASFRRELSARYEGGGVEAMRGADDVFAWLRTRGVRIALNTGFDREITDLLVRALRWSTGVVDAVVCGDDVRYGRPAPDLIHRAMALAGVTDASRVANVGDTTLDLQAAAAAGVRWNIGVLSGAHDRDRLERLPHTRLLAGVFELPTLWSSLS